MAGASLGPVDQSDYIMPSDTGSAFQIDTADCQHGYDVHTGSLGPGTYRVMISIDGATLGSGTFVLQ